MYVLASTSLAGYNLTGDTLVDNIDDFLDKAVMGDITSQKVVVDEGLLDAIGLLEELKFEVVMLHSYLRFKKKEDIEEPSIEKEEKSKKKAKRADKESKSVFESTTVEDEDDDIMPKGPLAFFARLFSGKEKKTQVMEISVPVTKVLPNMKDQIDEIDDPVIQELFKRGRLVKTYCVKNKYLTVKQIGKLDAIMNENIKYNRNKRFIQCARENGYLTEDQAADVLSHTVHREIISKTRCVISDLYPYNVEFLDMLKNFFIFKIDEDTKKVYVCKDCAEEAQLYILEQRFMNYEVITLNVIEGVTGEVIKELKSYANHG